MENITTSAIEITSLAPTSNITDTDDIQFDLYMIPVGILLVLINLATIVGNTLVILAIRYEHCLRTTTNYFIISLAVADMMLGFLVLPLSSAYELLGVWLFGRVLCTAWAAIDVLVCTASILNLVAISLDRYIAISRPMHYHNFATHRRVVAAIFGVWGLSVAVSIPPLFGWRAERTDPRQCELTSGMGYVIYSALGSYWIPLLIMLFVYGRIYTVAMSQAKNIQKNQQLGMFRGRESVDTDLADSARINKGVNRKESKISSSGSSLSQENIHEKHYVNRKDRGVTLVKRLKRFSKEARATRTLSIVIGAFVICWLPFFSVYLIGGVCEHCIVPRALFKAFFWLGYCNSFLNPIIYPLMNKDFKRAFRKLVRRTYCRRHSISYFDNRGHGNHKAAKNRRLRLSVPYGGHTPPESPNLNSRVSSPDPPQQTRDSRLSSLTSDKDKMHNDATHRSTGAILDETEPLRNLTLEEYEQSPGRIPRSSDNVLLESNPYLAAREANASKLRRDTQANLRDICYSEPNIIDFDSCHGAFDDSTRRKSSLSNNDISMAEITSDTSSDSRTKNCIRQPKDRTIRNTSLILSIPPSNGNANRCNDFQQSLTFDKNLNRYLDTNTKSTPILSRSTGDCTCNSVNNNILNSLKFIDDGTSSPGEPDVNINAITIFRTLSQKHMHPCC
ncbi:probable G-protein coupled receptor No9 [Lineus longissimus]|uniref:probable G-protein coupled receptor No9 n=1 Tax=Lineus longissimus TaxID=88925 RepID=UPI002B4E46B0